MKSYASHQLVGIGRTEPSLHAQERSSVRRFITISDHWTARACRRLHRYVTTFTLPVPVLIVRPMLAVFVLLREIWHFVFRVVICEPFFKASCASYGKGVRTGIYLPWVQGNGDIIVGDDVQIVGYYGVTFATRYSNRPTISIGDRTIIGHQCSFTVGKRISIGQDCLIASSVWMFDAPGHPVDPVARLARHPAPPEAVKPITIGNNVWIGRECIICPGVTIGDGAVISPASVVMTDVAPNSVVGGNPARRITYYDARQAGQSAQFRAAATE